MKNLLVLKNLLRCVSNQSQELGGTRVAVCTTDSTKECSAVAFEASDLIIRPDWFT